MKRILTAILCLSLLGNLYALPRVKKTKRIKALSLPLTMQRKMALQMRNYRLNPEKFNMSKAQMKEFSARVRKYPKSMRSHVTRKYTKALSSTRRLAKSLDIKIFYQGTEETRLLPPREIRADLRAIESALKQVEDAEVYFQAGENVPLQEAKTYLHRVKNFYQMHAMGEFGPLDEIPISVLEETQKTFNRDIFFLKDPAGVEEGRPLPLPEKLNVAIIRNVEEEEIISAFYYMKENEQLHGWKFDVYENPEVFLRAPGCLRYDLVITDIKIEGGGGEYLARKLRHHEFKGGVVALTAFREANPIGIELKANGIHNMISLPSYGFEEDGPTLLAQKLRNYFYYKNQIPAEKTNAPQPLP